jgi:hypothetical protein
MKTLLIATAVSALMVGSAHAACNPAPAITGGDTLTITATDCHLVITDPAVLPIVPGMSIVVHDPATGEIGSDGGALITGVNAALATKADTTYVDSENAAQNTAIGTKASTAYVNSENAAQNTVINGKVDKTRLDTFKPTGAVGPYSTLENWAGGVNSTLGTHNSQIAALNSLTASHGATLNAHGALLSEHSAKLEDHSKGLAIAMAMPDAWLSDKKRFGIFGAVGGFGDETALGFAAIGRIDETFSLNAKLGSDTEFKEYGWQVGVGAQW